MVNTIPKAENVGDHGPLFRMLVALASATRSPRSRGPPRRKYRRPPRTRLPGVTYKDITATSGIGSFRHVSGSPAKDYIIEVTGSGVALVDVDNDGRLDIYLVNGSTLELVRKGAAAPRAALFRNNGNRTFTDITADAGVANERWGQGVCVGDVDNDGFADIYVTNFGRNRLYRNSGRPLRGRRGEGRGGGRQLDDRVCLRRLRQRWGPGSVRRGLCCPRSLRTCPLRRQWSRESGTAPAPSTPRPAAGGVGMGASVLGWPFRLHLPWTARHVRPPRPQGRSRSPVPQQR